MHRFILYLCKRFGMHHPTFATGIIILGSSMMQSLFMFYYVKVFLNHYHITDAWFQISQVLFMIWNALNDPLFGYLQDVGDSWMRSRKRSIKYGAPLFALSFLLPWFAPWWQGVDATPSWAVGLHLIVALFFYDGFFSFVLLAYCALFTELTTDPAERVRFVKYSQTFALMAYFVIFFVDRASASLTNYGNFQVCCVIVAVIAYFCMNYTGTYAPDRVAQLSDTKLGNNNSSSSPARRSSRIEVGGDAKEKNCTWTERWQLSKEILINRDFHCLVWTNFFHICRSTSQVNFAAIVVESIIPPEVLVVGSSQMSLFYGFSAVVPQIVFILASPLANRYGPYRIFQWSLLAAIVNASIMMLMGKTATYHILVFILLDCILVHSISPLFNIMFPDVIDDDMQRYKRTSPISSLIFSINALFTKPAQSLAPMVVVYIFDLYGYDAYQRKALTDPAELASLKSAIFYVMCSAPILLSLCELTALRNYSLRNKHSNAQDAQESSSRGFIEKPPFIA